MGRELDVAAPVKTVENFIAGLRWSASGKGGVAVNPVAGDTSAGDVSRTCKAQDGARDEMGDRIDPDGFDARTSRDGVVRRKANEGANSVASFESRALVCVNVYALLSYPIDMAKQPHEHDTRDGPTGTGTP